MGGQIEIQIKHREKVLKLRRLDRLVQSSEFEYIWNHVDVLEKCIAGRMIWEVRYDDFKKWFQNQLDIGFKMYSIRDLRALASKHHVRYYSRKTRAELITVLTEKGVLNGNTSGSFS